MINWPGELVSDIARRRCVLVLGSGVSRNSINAVGRSPKTWAAFLQDQLVNIKPNAHIRKLLKENDYLTACEVIKSSLGRERFTRIVRDEFLTPAYIPAPIHEAIFKLDSRIVITPNFDKIYETYANAQANGSIVVKQHCDNDVNSVIRESGRVILKLHGSIDSPDNMVFTRAEYAKARTQSASFYEIVQALSLTHTFLFIGCGINDPDIKLLLEDTFFRHRSARSHVMILPSDSVHKSLVPILQETMNLRILNYSSKSRHAELLTSLQALGQAVDQEREQIRIGSNW